MNKKRKLEPRERAIRPGIPLGALRDEYGDFFGGFVGLPFSSQESAGPKSDEDEALT